MAMDKEKLLEYFQAHYFSRREVLFKLPLSMSIDVFWPELLNRRKAKATVLPLYNALGVPYWYVLTDKMIVASEKLCEEAISQDENFDPYRAPMTSAMTEEMFFTSFVEGAQIPINEAMDFLQRGTEPDNVQEQMIWNNRQAWSTMVKSLYKPLDEQFIKSLAFMLTDEMVGRADDYRQTDKHVIAAMNEDAYEVPPASVVANRMTDYYDFLRSPELHPLIKAAVGQAYLLTVRPFPEGNERLSRMVSSAVLLRSGYGYFRDISISNLIARESYRYYQAMREVLRPENGNDLTYFIEYYIDLLARALDIKKDKDKRREFERDKETLEKERELSLQPLGGDIENATSILMKCTSTTNVASASASKPVPTPAPAPATAPPLESKPDYIACNVDESPPDDTLYDAQTLQHYYFLLEKIATRKTPRTKRVTSMLRYFIGQGITQFNRVQWQEIAKIEQKLAQDDCQYMVINGLAVSDRSHRMPVYTLTLAIKDTSEQTDDSGQYTQMRVTLNDLCENGTSREKRIATVIMKMLDEGLTEFMAADLSKWYGHSKSMQNNDIRSAVNYGLLEYTDNGIRICKQVNHAVRYSNLNCKVDETLDILLSMYKNRPFTIDDIASHLDLKTATVAYRLSQLQEKNIITLAKKGKNIYKYSFTKEFLEMHAELQCSEKKSVITAA